MAVKKMQDAHIVMKKNLFKIFMVVLILFLGMLTINEFKESKYIGQGQQNTISVSGTGEVYSKPDLALVSFSVVSEGDTASQALSQNSSDMNAVIDYLKGEGIEDKDIKTTVFSISPRYEWHEDSKYYPSGERVLVGYEVIQSVQVKIRDMDKIGVLIEGATDAGANQSGSLQFTFDDEDELKKQARAEAIDKAKEKAKELAGQLGVRLGRVVDFYESSSPVYYDYAFKEASGLGGSAPSIETGENLVSSNVVITYEIYQLW